MRSDQADSSQVAGGTQYVVEASHVSKAARTAGVDAPVRTLWSREDDLHGGYYRPMHLHRARIGFDDKCVFQRSWTPVSS
jgi:isoquinoline 1-oxidoreductase beta subunit